jgi:hypothetical protein
MNTAYQWQNRGYSFAEEDGVIQIIPEGGVRI